MTLLELFAGADIDITYDIPPHLKNVTLNAVTDNTEEVRQGDVFVAIKGGKFDGHDAAAALNVKHGLAAVVCERDLGLNNQIIVPDTRKAMARLSSSRHGNPTRDFTLIGVTGTNGKSTVTAMLQHIINSRGGKAGTVGTIGYDTGNGIPQPAHYSLPPPRVLYRLFAEMRDNGVTHCVIEATSQALAQSRFYGERFKLGLFTNLTRDHLDSHGTMEEYYRAKSQLFSISDTALICTDDEWGERMLRECGTKEKYGIYCADDYDGDGSNGSDGSNSKFIVSNIQIQQNGVRFILKTPAEYQEVQLAMPGRFNAANGGIALAAATLLGVPVKEAAKSFDSFCGVKGRCEIVYNNSGVNFVCDYAHTEDALEKILTAMKPYVKNRLICLFGATGERDKGKRPIMGRTAAKYADYLIITSDNPNFENPDDIIDEVLAGVTETAPPPPYERYADRAEAVRRACEIAVRGDIVLMCGKGHEEYQTVAGEYKPFSERGIVAEYFHGG